MLSVKIFLVCVILTFMTIGVLTTMKWGFAKVDERIKIICEEREKENQEFADKYLPKQHVK